MTKPYFHTLTMGVLFKTIVFIALLAWPGEPFYAQQFELSDSKTHWLTDDIHTPVTYKLRHAWNNLKAGYPHIADSLSGLILEDGMQSDNSNEKAYSLLYKAQYYLSLIHI